MRPSLLLLLAVTACEIRTGDDIDTDTDGRVDTTPADTDGGPDTGPDTDPNDTAGPDGDSDGVGDLRDCAPTDPAVYPGAAEVCAGDVDDDCDPTTACGSTCLVSFAFDDTCDGTLAYTGPAPLLLWTFEPDEVVDGDPRDRTSNGHHGTTTGALDTEAEELGLAGSAAVFDGDTTVSWVGSDAPAAFTVAAWVRTSASQRPSGDALAVVFDLGHGPDDWTGLFAGIASDGTWRATTEHGDGDDETVATTTGTACDARWQHVAVTLAAGTLTIYVDGAVAVSEALPAATPTWGTNPVTLAGALVEGFAGYEGVVDEFAMWDVALSGADLAQAINDGLCGRSIQKLP